MRRAHISHLAVVHAAVVGASQLARLYMDERGTPPPLMRSMADIGRPEREIEVVPREAPLPRELPLEPPAPAPDEPMPIEDPVPA